ncbi:MAG: 30S ribosomal protein S20, partial [Acidimicrobiia bacterium]|nr:30S ribosomal protein S20 [Acidimicrobiia bacterium]
MANIKSQIKRNRQNEVLRQRNKAVRSELKTQVKKTIEAVQSESGDAAERYRSAQAKIDT